VTIGNSVTTIGETAFWNCPLLSSVTIPNSVTTIGKEAFADCSGLSSVTIGNSVTSIGYAAFGSCKSLTSVTIPNSVTSIGGRAFSGCSHLTSVTIGNSVTKIEDEAFRNCSSLTSVTIPNTMWSLGIGNYAFRNCSGLTSIEIPNSVKNISSTAFAGCSGLTLVKINSNEIVSRDYTNSGSNVGTKFGEQVREYIIGNDVNKIGSGAFSDCSKLTSVTIPNSVTSIGNSAFSWCGELTKVIVYIESPLSIDQLAFSNRAKATLYVPQGRKEVYKAARYWKEFKEIKEFIPSGIKTIDNDQTAEELETGNWYTLDGSKLNGKPSKKGFYIINGRKVIVK
jgi:hypothetical protein